MLAITSLLAFSTAVVLPRCCVSRVRVATCSQLAPSSWHRCDSRVVEVADRFSPPIKIFDFFSTSHGKQERAPGTYYQHYSCRYLRRPVLPVYKLWVPTIRELVLQGEICNIYSIVITYSDFVWALDIMCIVPVHTRSWRNFRKWN